MNSKTLIVTILVAAVVGLISAKMTLHFAGDSTAAPVTDQVLEQRIEQLETELKLLKNAELTQQSNVKTGPSTAVTGASIDANPENVGQSEPIALTEQAPPINPALSNTRFQRFQREYRKQNLLEAGFANGEAELILSSESEVALAALNDQYERQRQQYLANKESGEQRLSRSQRLRQQIGDDMYERYLRANSRPTSVPINSVLEYSPGANAGLQAGDRITAYAGERVFNLRDLNSLTVQGDVGTSVLIEVERDGQPVQLTIPRGPVGITAGRR